MVATKLINLLTQVEWRILLPSIGIAVALPTIDMVIRFLIPIVSGIVWVFLKPIIVKLRDKNKKTIKMKESFLNFMDDLKNLYPESKWWLSFLIVLSWFIVIFIHAQVH